MQYNPQASNKEEPAKVSFAGQFFYYFSFILIIPIFVYIGQRNELFRLKQKIEESSANIDVQLKERLDMLSKLVDATKQYMQYEKETLSKIVSLRNSEAPIKSANFTEVNDFITNQLRGINVVLENYPDLKASANVIQLQSAIAENEDKIANARRFYNSQVREFNARLFTWPSNVAAHKMRLHTYLYFEASLEERDDIKISLNGR